MTSISLRHLLLAGALAMPLCGLCGLEAEAMPAARLSVAASHDGVVTVQYMRYPHYRYRRFNRHRHAGLYNCGPRGLSTHLERTACR